jgi:hypothetical protein
MPPRARPLVPLPPSLQGQAFWIGDGYAAGLREGRMYGADLLRPTRGVRSDRPLETLAELARAVSLVLPSDIAFSHATAAQLMGLPLPRRHEDRTLHIMRDSGVARVRRPECRPHRGLESRRMETARGLPVVSACDTWCDLGEVLGLDELIVLGDQVARRSRSVEPLAAALARRVRPRGALRLREALTWIRVGSDSPMETRVRLMFVRAGLPEPELNATITDEHGGFLARGDFVWRRQRVIGEYQGAAHFADFDRGDDDISRRLLAEDGAWKYIEVTKRDYVNPGRRHATIRRFARYLGVEL